MLDSADAHRRTDKRIAVALSRRTGFRLNVRVPPPFTRSDVAAQELRRWMEDGDRAGEIRESWVNETARARVFFYICRTPRGEPYAQGVGTTPQLAICDAFLQCGPPTRNNRRQES